MGEPANVWITRVDDDVVAGTLAGTDPSLPLAGLTLAVKDNIDVAGLPTTAGCPAYAYTAGRSAPVVQRLVDAGAVVVGKANMDQFATGLTGSRSPYGRGASVLDPERVSGGSSSGSAVAVAAGLAAAALGTDTAGSGRVPAACNGIVGFKPSPGLLPLAGIVPACRTLDCPSVFTRTVGEAERLLAVLVPGAPVDRPPDRRLRVGVADEASQVALHPEARAAYGATVDAVAARAGVDVGPVDLRLLFEVGDLLYGGAWVAERYHAVGRFIEAHPGDVEPVVASIILGARGLTAVDAFGDRYRLDDLAARVVDLLDGTDVLLLPTVPHVPTLDEVAADPVGTNTALGRYTTFANLLGMCAVSLPGTGRRDGVPGGVSVVARGGDDHLALEAAGRVAEATAARIPLAVVGAHLDGQPLNRELTGRGGRLQRATRTAPAYRLHALATVPPKPGLVRVAGGGSSIEVEVWTLAPAAFGDFVAAVPSPLAIGKVELDDGSWVPGFLCEPAAVEGAADITVTGGWRAYLRSGAAGSPRDRA